MHVARFGHPILWPFEAAALGFGHVRGKLGGEEGGCSERARGVGCTSCTKWLSEIERKDEHAW